MKDIQADSRNIQDMLGNARFRIDYFQREYRWEKKHIEELIEDLSQAFLNNYEASHSRSEVMNYDLYFLGSMITSSKDGQKSIVDGQQRLTSITLLLIYLYHSTADSHLTALIAPLISCYKFGEHAYNLNVQQRRECMDFLFGQKPLNPTATENPSIANMIDRYEDFESVFPEEISQGESLPYFIDWLLQKVYLVEIAVDSDADAYAIFETMNDRGLSLTPTEMLRGYLLANINEPAQQHDALSTWDSRVKSLLAIGKGEDAHAIRAWLRSQHAKSIRQGRRGAVPRDFDIIGTEFHRWVRDRHGELALNNSDEFSNFIIRDFEFYAHWYETIRRAGDELTPGLEPFFYVARTNFTLHYMTALSPLLPTDSHDVAMRKLSTVATSIDCLISRRIWNGRAIGYGGMRVPMFRDIALKIRHLDTESLATQLCDMIDDYDEQFHRSDFSLNRMNRPKVHHALARMTDYVDSQSGRSSLYRDYLKRWGRGHYQIEHVLSESHRERFDDFDHHRNKIGALVLLPGRVNASIGDKPYEGKRVLYPQHNLLSGSLHDQAYENNPGFNAFIRRAGLDFKPYDVFDVNAINERQELYRQLAERIWSTDSIWQAAGLTPPVSSTDTHV